MPHLWESWTLYSRDRRSKRLVLNAVVRCRKCGVDRPAAKKTCGAGRRR